ncbi:MAG: hypothetical protein JXA96_08085 [Sedimentisphaerales bacterium]|nr:hypothetical protein [Sedimentisphaerales bacterium]
MNKKINSKREKYSCIILLVIFSIILIGCSKKKSSETDKPGTYDVKVLVLDDCGIISDSNEQSKTDSVLMLDSGGKLLKKIDGFQVKEGYGENKAISVSEDGRFFVVCEDGARKLSIYETSTGSEYWSHTWPDRVVHTAVFFNNTLYVYGTRFIMSIDVSEIGKKDIKEIGGYWNGVWLDVAFDKKNNSIWAVGSIIRKYNLDFEQEFQIGSVFDSSVAGAFSVDTTSDGSAWVAVQEVIERNNLENQLLKISSDGKIIKTIQLDVIPICVCVDKSDDSVWVTGMTSNRDYSKIGDEWPETLTELNEAIKTDVQTYTHKYNANGDKILELDKGGYSIVIDSTDKSAWVACHDSIVHYSDTGEIINEYKDVSKQHKWIALVPKGEK